MAEIYISHGLIIFDNTSLIYLEGGVSDFKIQIKQRRLVLWLTKQLYARTAEQNLLLLRVNRNFTKKRDLTTNRKDALNAEEQENNKEITETMEIDINSDFYCKQIKVDF